MKKTLVLIFVIVLVATISAEHVVEQEVYGVLSDGVLPEQEVAAFYEFNYSFETGLENVTCEGTNFPEGMTFSSDGSKCYVWWDGTRNSARPNNDQRTETGHSVSIEASDNESTYYFYFNIKVYSWIINLEEGWNLISIPLVPEDGSEIENVLASIHDNIGSSHGSFSVYQYDGVTRKWIYNRPNETGWDSGELDEIVPGYGYWINMENADILKGMGKESEGGLNLLPEVKVVTNNWNLIGRYGIIGEDWIPSEYNLNGRAHGPLQKDVALDSVKIESDTLQIRVVDSAGDLQNTDYLYNNKGYWAWIEDDSTHESQEAGYAPIDDYYEWHNVGGITLPL